MHSISNSVNRKFIDSVDLSHLEIETDTGWATATKILKTIPYAVWQVTTESGILLECADDHILFDDQMNEIFVKNIIPLKTQIQTVNGIELIIDVTTEYHEESMFDIAVDSPDHRYYTNGILSHNTTIINALSYGLFGSALTSIKKNNLINKTNGKGMLVTIEFEKDGLKYRIERGRKPMVLQFFIDEHEQDIDDFAQGDSRKTQEDINKLMNMSHDMFKHIIALNTYTEPFLAMRAMDQRNIIEQLLGITLLSEKAEALREDMKIIKDGVKEEEFKINAQIRANEKISETIINLERRQTVWLKNDAEQLQDLLDGLAALSHVDIKAELKAHEALNAWNKVNDDHKALEKEYSYASRSEETCSKYVDSSLKDYTKAKEKKCPTCEQDLHNDTLLDSLKEHYEQCVSEHNAAVIILDNIVDQMEDGFDPGDEPEVFYKSEHDAREHQTTLKHIKEQIKAKEAEGDPYAEQIYELKNEALVEINYDEMNGLVQVRDHQEFLLKLLTNKDSYIRKKIIDQNLSYLNHRLDYYLTKIGLPHTVEFQNDLNVEITEYGRDLDFDNLSRGERNRLILSLSWAFRDVWENLYQPINLLFIDELIDSGMDSIGVENSLGILKKIARERKKSVWLVSHKDDLAARVNNVLTVTKENGFTSYASDVEIV